MIFFLKKKNIRGLLSLSVLMQLFMSALAKSHTKILHMLFFFSLLILPKKEKKKKKTDIKVWGSELKELSQPELHILWSLQASCLLIKKDRLREKKMLNSTRNRLK